MKTFKNNNATKKGYKALEKPTNLLLIIGLAIFAFTLFIAIGVYLGSFHRQFISRSENSIFSLADSKASLVGNWRNDRLKDAFMLQNNTALNTLARKLATDPDNEVIKKAISKELKVFLTFHPYDIFVLDPSGTPFFSYPRNANLVEPQFYRNYLESESEEISFVDFYENPQTGAFHLGMVVPLHSGDDRKDLSLVVRMNPAIGLYDVIRTRAGRSLNVKPFLIAPWEDKYLIFYGEPNKDDDMLFVEKYYNEGEDVLYSLLDNNSFVKRGKGINEEEVFAGLREVGGTSWMVMVQLSDKELLTAVRQRILTVFVLGGAFLLSVISLMIVLTRQQQIRLLKISRENENLLDDLINNQPSGIYRVSLEPEKSKPGKDDAKRIGRPLPIRYLFVSKQHDIITGIPGKELMDNSSRIFETIHPEDRDNFLEENFKAVDTISNFHWEGRIVNRGEIRWARFDSVPRLNPPSQIIWTGVVMDITVQKKLESDMKRREAFERLLTRLSSSFVNITAQNCDKIIDLSIEYIGRFCDTDRSYIFLWDEKRNIVKNTHEWCSEGIEPQKELLQMLPCEEIPQWMSHLKSFTPVVIPDVSKMEDSWRVEKAILEPQGVKSLVVVPVISDEKLYGFVGFDSVKAHRKWKEYELQLLKVFADLVYNALERRRAELNLTESRKMLRTVLDTIQVRVFWKDKNLRYQGCNQAYARDAGFDAPEDLIGLEDTNIWKDMAEIYRKSDERVIETERPLLNFEEPQKAKDGTTRWLNTSKIPLLNNEGQVMGVLGTYQDITEQKLAEDALRKSENRYRKLTENAFDGIYLLRRNQFEYVNQRFCEMTGYSYQQLIQPEFDNLTLFTPESHQLALDRKEARNNGEPLPSTYEMQIITTMGEIKDVEISTNKLNNIGEENLILGIVRDITERKNNERLRNEIAVANQSANFKQNFLANMSHEIRTPLTGVLGMIEILSQTQLNETQLDYISTLKLSTENLREIINQILDYSKIEAGQVNLKTTIFETAVIFEHARKLFQTTCKKEVQLLIEVADEVPEFIETDEQRLTQIINNLLSNAIKFTEQGKICISAGVDNWKDELNFILKITVEDTGIGIKKEALSRLFKPFEQVDYEDKRNFDGTGLGLSISKELVRLMGGEVFVESKPGKGSKFWFTFEACKAVFSPIESFADSDPETANGGGINILFAEDKEINQKVVKLMLNALGHRVSLASNGEEALKMYQPGLFDLILMDIQMPVMDGITAIQRLRERFSQLPPIVGLSANAFEGDREKYIKQGMDEYLTKPVKSDDLKNMIEKLQLLYNKDD
ncbi:MAG: PAS domain S-box protein [Bacteroidetes bacterium]|nr:MAG: PAS domain S-box protein [Bacteroidota bacterium]